MKPRTTIFLSGVSHEFGSFRDAVENEIQKKGCFADNEPGFAEARRLILKHGYHRRDEELEDAEAALAP